jgi:hypothetical protein
MVRFEDQNSTILILLDEVLSKQWKLMKGFCSLMNWTASAKCRLPEQVLINNMAAIPYPLLYVKYETNTLAEATRLGMLAFCSHIFLQWHSNRPPSTSFQTRYRECYDKMKALAWVHPEFALWYTVLGCMSVFEKPDSDWLVLELQMHVKNQGIESWSHARDILKEFFWIHPVHDNLGKKLFESIFSSNAYSVDLQDVQ